jgi:phosphoglycerate dehydrogenase-like enzyme
MKSLTIWSNHGLNGAQEQQLRAALGTHRLLAGSAATPAELARADIAFGQPPLADAQKSETLRWVQLSSAGYTSYSGTETERAFRARDARLTTSSHVYAAPCAEHVLSFMLAWARQLPAAFSNQQGAKAWPQGPIRQRSRLLENQRVVVYGYGSIGERLAQLLAPFTPHVSGVRRKPRGDESIETFGFDDARADERLASADHVVNVLPAAEGTARYFDRARLGRIKRGAAFYNVGRGNTVDQKALVELLARGDIAAALLDVTDPEPLPPNDPLWSAPNCFITPHSAGGHHDEGDRLVAHFITNFERYTSEQPLLDRIY